MKSRQQILDQLAGMGISPKRSLGQNFLISPKVIGRIIQEVSGSDCGDIIEVGPGLGALTESLKTLGPRLLLIELDREFAAYWRSQDLRVFEKDALDLDWASLEMKASSILVSNLPYQISARIVIDRSVSPKEINRMVLMFQKEVAERIMAQPRTKAYGFLTVVAQSAWDIRRVVDASANDFYPPPRVASRVLSFQRRAVLDPAFIAFVKQAFQNRRKLMIKNFTDSSARVSEFLTSYGYGLKARAEEISVNDFQKLYDVIREANGD